jgi:HTH-type transcriptional regulator/antitoxin HigA
LTERGLLSDTKDKVDLLRETLAFYGVSSESAWQEIWGARRSPCFETQPGAASAWVRQGELLSHKTACKPFDKSLFLQALDTIRSLTQDEESAMERSH